MFTYKRNKLTPEIHEEIRLEILKKLLIKEIVRKVKNSIYKRNS